MTTSLYRKLITIISSYPRRDKEAKGAMIRLMNRQMSEDEQAYWFSRGKYQHA